MRAHENRFAPKGWYLDFFFAFIIIGLNPVTYFLNSSIRHFSPDTIANMAMGRDLFHKGLLYIPSWSHEDTGLILPPPISIPHRLRPTHLW